MATRIDAHQHFWRLADRGQHWPPPTLAAIHRDFLPEDLLPLLHHAGVDGTVLVQSLPQVTDTEFLLRLADRHDFVRGVVGWVDLGAHDAPAQIARLAQHPKLVGLRPMLQDLPNARWIDDPGLQPAVDAMLSHQLCFDALVQPRHLPAMVAFARRNPRLSIVIDHAAKPAIASGDLTAWRSDMARLADRPHVYCKLSGLLTEAGEHRDLQALRPTLQTVFDLFGPERLMWGSDWPVLRLAGDYDAWLAMCETACDLFLTGRNADAERDAIFGRNALRFYSLD